jgi:hypothetical protein
MTPERELAIYATGVVIAIVVACVADRAGCGAGTER